MAVHHGKEGQVAIGGTAVGELTGFTLETSGDVVESTKMEDGAKSFIAGRTSFSGTLEMHFDEAVHVQIVDRRCGLERHRGTVSCDGDRHRGHHPTQQHG